MFPKLDVLEAPKAGAVEAKLVLFPNVEDAAEKPELLTTLLLDPNGAADANPPVDGVGAAKPTGAG